MILEYVRSNREGFGSPGFVFGKTDEKGNPLGEVVKKVRPMFVYFSYGLFPCFVR